MAAPPPVLDHVVVDVRDRIDEAAQCFRALGFQLTPRGHHTLGSANHLAIFATDYLELLGFADDGAIRPEIMRFPLGLNGLVFKTADADSDYREAAAAGLPILPVQSFSRPVALDATCTPGRESGPSSSQKFIIIRQTWLMAVTTRPTNSSSCRTSRRTSSTSIIRSL